MGFTLSDIAGLILGLRFRGLNSVYISIKMGTMQHLTGHRAERRPFD